LTEELLSEIYPDNTPEENAELLAEVEAGAVSVESIIDEAFENSVDIDWDLEYEDNWTDCKGGYDITFRTKQD
jgi:hypothetical protein